ncbi:MAG: DinB family protein, partial [Myxococcales bacterium]|nr:DinB family protein [Myxococcales bacterium]
MRVLTIVTIVLAPLAALAQPKPPAIDPANPISSSLKGNYERVKKFILGAADEIAPADYAFKPTPDVRSFAQLLGHVADASYMFCGAAKKEPKSNRASAEKTATTKDAMKKSLAEAFAYCDAVYASSTDA